MIDIQGKKEKALKGREIWLAIKTKYEIDDNSCVVLLDCEYETESIVNNILPRFLKKKYLDKAIVLSSADISKYVNDAENIICHKLDITDKDLLLTYRKTSKFFEYFIVVSSEEPFGNFNLVGKHGITMDSYIEGTFF